MSHKKEDRRIPIDIESLNVDDLDIEELEHRIELASAAPIIPDVWSCESYTECGSFGGPKPV